MTCNTTSDLVHLTPSEEFSLEDFYFKGACFMQMDEILYNNFENVFEYIDWEPDPDGVYKRIPAGVRPKEHDVPQHWDKFARSEAFNKAAMDNTSPMVKKLVVDLLQSKPFQKLGEITDFDIQFLDVWDGSEGLTWHWDGFERSEFLVLAYFSDHEEWKPEFGGQLEFGRKVSMSSMTDPAEDGVIDSYGVVPPAKRSLVIVNNANPFLVHRCFSLADKDTKRITMTLGVKMKTKADFTQSTHVKFC